MSELFDKQVNAQKENSKKYFWGSRKLPQAHKKCAMKMKVETNDGCLKYFCWEYGLWWYSSRQHKLLCHLQQLISSWQFKKHFCVDISSRFTIVSCKAKKKQAVRDERLSYYSTFIVSTIIDLRFLQSIIPLFH